MKRICITFAFWFTFACSFSQIIVKKDTTKPKPIPQIALEDISKLLPQISPKSPNVAGLEKFGLYPVSMYTGLPTIEIPLYEIKIGNIIIPIKLVYHAGGNKVSDNASWVGLGWSLVGQYSVSRNVRGRADEDAGNGGLLGQNLPSYPQFISCLTEQIKSDLNEYISFGKDIERDVFTYRTPSKSNSFLLTPSSVVFQESDKSKITYSNGLGSFTITDENGYIYTFSEAETTFANNITNTTAWHLTSIQGTKPTEKAVLLTKIAKISTLQQKQPIQKFIILTSVVQMQILFRAVYKVLLILIMEH
jgi:hypothetical protein